MGVIDRDGRKFLLQGEGGFLPHGSDIGRLPTMDGRPCAGAWRTGTPKQFGLQPGHAFLPVGERLEHFGSPGRMDTDKGRAPLRRGNHSNLSPHGIPPRGGPLAIFPIMGHKLSYGRETLSKFWVSGALFNRWRHEHASWSVLLSPIKVVSNPDNNQPMM